MLHPIAEPFQDIADYCSSFRYRQAGASLRRTRLGRLQHLASAN